VYRNEKSNSHKRKFFEHEGKFIKDINNPIEESGKEMLTIEKKKKW